MNRATESFKKIVKKPIYYTQLCIKAFFVFNQPIAVLASYFSKKNVPKIVALRNGLTIELSDDTDDISTVFIVFVKRDYGKLNADVVLDVGANIGLFSLYCAAEGVGKVYSFEPSKDSYEILVRNIARNGFEDIVVPCKKAVTSVGGATVKFNAQSSVLNKIGEVTDNNYDLVETVSLSDIIAEFRLEIIDLIKMDIEGGEYDVAYNLDLSTAEKIREFRMEYHEGNSDSLTVHFENLGFRKTLLTRESDMVGNIFFVNIKARSDGGYSNRMR